MYYTEQREIKMKMKIITSENQWRALTLEFSKKTFKYQCPVLLCSRNSKIIFLFSARNTLNQAEIHLGSYDFIGCNFELIKENFIDLAKLNILNAVGILPGNVINKKIDEYYMICTIFTFERDFASDLYYISFRLNNFDCIILEITKLIFLESRFRSTAELVYLDNKIRIFYTMESIAAERERERKDFPTYYSIYSVDLSTNWVQISDETAIFSDYLRRKYCLTKPSILQSLEKGNELWFSGRDAVRGSNYFISRIFLKDNFEGANFTKLSKVYLHPTSHNTKMQCYPEIFSHNGVKKLLFSGSNYGEGGIFLCEE
jgi:hypothetical protein